MSTEDKLDSEEATDAPEETDGSTEELATADEPVALADASGKRTIGLERWVQLGFMAAAILLAWLYDHLVTAIWYVFADPNEAVASGVAVLAGLASAAVLYGNKRVYGLVHDVAEELSKVTWPTRKETSSSTVVVVITSIVAALVLFLFDSVWSTVTDLVYKV